MRPLTTAFAALIIGALLPATALACGGFFCNNLPIDQAGEEILFGVDPDAGTVQATIRIFYQGDAEDFAWVLPVPTVPTLDVSSDEVFTALRGRTNPSWNLEWNYEGECGVMYDMALGADPSAPSAEADDGGPGGGVQVVDSGQVGSFDYEVVESDSGEALFDWLNDNGYVQPEAAKDIIESYVSQGMVFVALKLQQTAGAGDITPVVLNFSEQAPCVPLVLTRIAAQPDMPVRIYVASTARAVPTNWFGVEVNQKLVDWIGGGSNYEDLVSTAVDDAAGHGFITEYAGSNEIFDKALYQEGDYNLEPLEGIGDPAQWLMSIQGQFQPTATLLSILREFIPLPAQAAEDGYQDTDLYNCPDCYPQYMALIDFDPVAATEALDEKIVQPRKEAQQLLDRYPYFTRMYTKVSPEEMTRDPLFAFNSGLPDVSKDHEALATVICDGSDIEDIIITIPGEDTEFTPEIPEWWFGREGGPVATDLSAERPARRVLLLPENGPQFEVERDDIAFVETQFSMFSSDQIIAELTGTDISEPGDSDTSGQASERGGCSQSGGGTGGLTFLFSLAFAGVLWCRRRLN